ncbi:hypothetical protein VXS03_08630 [Photobacterium sp. S4TG1]|uniref:hypothetical protein n=1 Tax=Photobacterium sp. S4TG1 TaxID=3114587 RepID=UPI002E1790FB|nr:hypothetical protein [Photobacterium sp. S4TG1]
MNIIYDTNVINCDKSKHHVMCNQCIKVTEHYILASIEQFGTTTADEDVYWNCKNQIIQCLECNSVSFRTVSICSERQAYDDKGEYYYPEKIEIYG